MRWGSSAQKLLVVAIAAWLICEVSVASAAPAITVPVKDILELDTTFDGKKVACRRETNENVVGGRLLPGGTNRRKWKSFELLAQEFIEKGKAAKATRYLNAATRYDKICTRQWKIAKKPRPVSETLQTTRRNSLPLTLKSRIEGPVTYVIKRGPANGSLSGSGKDYVYTPNPQFVGTDSFTFTARANGFKGGNATITINVGQCGFTANDTTISIVEGTTVDFLMPAQDSCKPDLPLQFTITRSPSHGSLQEAFPRALYTPNDHSVRSDSFSFRAVNDLGEALTATVTLNIDAAAGDFAGNPNLLGRYRETLSAAEVQSVLDRVAFGGTDAQRNIRSLTALVNSLLDTPESPALKTFYDDYNQRRMLRSQAEDKSFNYRWFWGDVQVLSADQLVNGNPFQAWMAQGFWHNHFTANVTEWSNSGDSNFMPEHLQRLQRNALGNYRDFVEDMLGDAIFHMYLNNFDNTYSAPNENFGREFLELFTAGIQDPVTGEANFSEADVVASTRALSGYSWGHGSSYPGSRPLTTGLPVAQEVRASDAAYYLENGQVFYRTWVQVRFHPVMASNIRRIILQRAARGSGAFAQVASVTYSPDTASIYDHSAVLGTVYDYRVRFEGLDGSFSDASDTDSGHRGYPGALPPTTSALSATAGGETPHIVLSWGTIPGASGYQVMRRAYDDGEWLQISPVLSSSTVNFTDTRVYPNKVYVYQILPVMPDGIVGQVNYRDTAVYGRDFTHGYYEAPVGSVTAPSNVLPTETDSARVTVSWEPAPGAVAYRIYRYPMFRELPQYLGQVQAPQTIFQDTTSVPGSRYRYMVRSVGPDGSMSSYATATFNPWTWNASPSNLTPLTFLMDLSPSSPNAAGRITSPQPMSARGLSFRGQPGVTSFVDHVLYNWPAPRRQLAAKLFAHLAHREINEELVSQVANVLLQNDFDLKPVLRLILSSSAMFSPEAHNTCVQSPLEGFYSFIRRSGLTATTADTRWRYTSRLSSTGYTPLAPPSVFGWKNCGVVRGGIVEDGGSWTESAQTYIALGNGISGALSDATVARSGQYPGEGMNLLAHFVPEGASAQPGVVVDRLASTLGVAMTPAQRSVLIEYLNTSDTGTVSAFNGASHLSRVTGLLRMLAMSEDYLTK